MLCIYSGGAEVCTYSFLTSPLDESARLSTRSDRFWPRERGPKPIVEEAGYAPEPFYMGGGRTGI